MRILRQRIVQHRKMQKETIDPFAQVPNSLANMSKQALKDEMEKRGLVIPPGKHTNPELEDMIRQDVKWRLAKEKQELAEWTEETEAMMNGTGTAMEEDQGIPISIPRRRVSRARSSRG